MKEKRFKHGILFLALAMLLLIPASFSLAKYTETADVGTVTLNITVDPPVLDQNWKDVLSTLNVKPTALVVGSFDEENEKLNQLFKWEDGTYIGEKSGSSYTKGVRLFMNGGTAYLLARGNNAVTFPTICSYIFNGGTKTDSTVVSTQLGDVETIVFNNINTSQVTNMRNMFFGSQKLKTMDVSRFNTSNVTDMGRMFGDCVALLNLDLRSFNTSQVTDMGNMFLNCSKLEQVTLGVNFRFDTSDDTSYLPAQTESNITGADGLWYTDQATGFTPVEAATHQETVTGPTTYYAVGTEAPAPPPAVLDKSFKSQIPETATKLVLGSWNDLKARLPENTTWGSGIIYVGEKVNGTYSDQVKLFMGEDGTTAYVLAKGSLPVTFPKDSVYLFSSQKLTDIKFDNIDTLNVTDMGRMFFSCIKLTSLDLTGFDTRQVTDMHWMFVGCKELTSLNVTSFDTRNVKNMAGMFTECSKLTALDVTGFDTRNVFQVSSMFGGCSSLKQLDLSSFNTQKVTQMTAMFKSCSKLEQVTLGKDFKFVGTGSYLPAQTESNITGADGKWYIDSETGFTPAEVVTHQAGVSEATIYYAVKTKAPAADPAEATRISLGAATTPDAGLPDTKGPTDDESNDSEEPGGNPTTTE